MRGRAAAMVQNIFTVAAGVLKLIRHSRGVSARALVIGRPTSRSSLVRCEISLVTPGTVRGTDYVSLNVSRNRCAINWLSPKLLVSCQERGADDGSLAALGYLLALQQLAAPPKMPLATYGRPEGQMTPGFFIC